MKPIKGIRAYTIDELRTFPAGKIQHVARIMGGPKRELRCSEDFNLLIEDIMGAQGGEWGSRTRTIVEGDPGKLLDPCSKTLIDKLTCLESAWENVLIEGHYRYDKVDVDEDFLLVLLWDSDHHTEKKVGYARRPIYKIEDGYGAWYLTADLSGQKYHGMSTEDLMDLNLFDIRLTAEVQSEIKSVEIGSATLYCTELHEYNELRRIAEHLDDAKILTDIVNRAARCNNK